LIYLFNAIINRTERISVNKGVERKNERITASSQLQLKVKEIKNKKKLRCRKSALAMTPLTEPWAC